MNRILRTFETFQLPRGRLKFRQPQNIPSISATVETSQPSSG